MQYLQIFCNKFFLKISLFLMSEYSESYQKVEYLEQVTTSIACLGESRVKLNTHIEQMNALFE